jgi:hypothetical protein
MQNKPQITRIRQPIHLTLSKETINLLKNTGNNASKVIDTLIKDAFSQSSPIRVLIGDFQWARRDSNSRPPPCEGDVIADYGGLLSTSFQKR